MKNYKVITILKTFTKKDIYNFTEFLNSPYFNTEAPKKKLFKALIKYHPDFDDPKFTNERIFKATYGRKEPFKSKKLRDKMSDLTLTLQEFLVIERIIHKKTDIKRQLKLAFEERSLGKLFYKEFKQILHDFAVIENKNIRDYSHMFLNYLDLYYSQLNTQKAAIFNIDFTREAKINLDKFYYLSNMQFGLETLARTKYQRDRFTLAITPILDAVKKKNYKEEIFNLFVLLIELFQTVGNQELFEKVYNYFVENWEKLKTEDQETMIAYLTNYVVLSINSGNEKFYQYSFVIHKFGIESELLIKNKTIYPVLFFNIASFGAVAKEFEWTKYFIDNYQNYIEEKYREETVNLCYGMLYSNMGKHVEAIRMLNRRFSAFNYPFSARSLLVREYFIFALSDSFYYDQFSNLLRTYKQYIHRNSKKLTQSRSKHFLEFIKIFSQAKKLIEKNTSAEDWKNFLNTELLSKNPTTKKWFQKTLEENNCI